jgi:DNA-binding transcriptional LysR family regulator
MFTMIGAVAHELPQLRPEKPLIDDAIVLGEILGVAVTVQPRLVVSNPEAASDAIIAGIGLARASSYYVKASLEDGTLTTVLDAFQPATRPVNFVYPAGRYMPIKLRAFLDFAAPRLKPRLA